MNLPVRYPRLLKGSRLEKRKAASGLTLVELLAVITLIAVLVVLLIPAVSRIKNNAKTAQCMANTRTYGLAVLAYAAEHNGLPNYIGRTSEAVKYDSPNGGWILALYPTYINQKSENKLRCPLANADSKKSSLEYQYALNATLCYFYPRLIGFPVPSSRVVLAMEGHAETYTFGANLANKSMWGNAQGPSGDAQEDSSQPIQYHGSSARRGLHCFFLDGHVELVFPQDGNWKNSPTYGATESDKDNGGYFYDYIQFSRMSQGM